MDGLAKRLASATSRRQLLRIAAGALVGMLARPVRSALAQSSPPSLPAMANLTGQHCTVYYSASVDAGFAQTYADDFDIAWKYVGDTLNSYRTDNFTIYLPADPGTFEQLLLAGGVSASMAAAFKTSAPNVNNNRGTMWVNLGLNSPPRIDVVGIGHEYTEDRCVALQPGNQAAGWFWDGLADTLGSRMSALVAGATCDFRRITRWRDAMLAIRDGHFLSLAGIVTNAQWSPNIGTPAGAVEYGEGFAAVQYWLQRFGLASLVQFVQAPKQQVSDFASAMQKVTSISADQFERDYLAAMRSHLNDPLVTVPLSVHLDPNGVTPQTAIFLQVNAAAGQIFRTDSGLAAGDYLFTLQPDGTVASADGKTTLQATGHLYDPASEGNIFVNIDHPAYQGQAGTDGREGLELIDIFGRAGLVHSFFASHITNAIEEKTGDCLAAWPDGNSISAAVDATSADLFSPAGSS